MTPDLSRLQVLLGGEPLARLRRRLRARFERRGTRSGFTLAALHPDERAALERLLGLPLRSASSLKLSLDNLDTVLARAGLAPNLRAALEALDGPIADRAGAAAAYRAHWDSVVAGANPRLRAFLVSPGGLGLLKRLSRDTPSRAAELVSDAARVLSALPAQGVQRSMLAAQVVGDAHGLDGGSPVATLVLRVLRAGEDEDPRDTWATAGVLVNELAKPVLALNLPAPPVAHAGFVNAARQQGEPLHLNLRWLLSLRERWPTEATDVFVCENPALVAAAADRLGGRCPPLVCSEGMPAAAQQVLVRQLRESGARLHYHGDFDWAGIRIGNIVIGRHGAAPWRFTAGHYRDARGRALKGPPVIAAWDSELTARMTEVGRALEEETVLEALLADLEAASDQRLAASNDQ